MSNPFYFPAHEVQRPTHPRIHITSAEEAHALFEAVRLGHYRPVIRRLNEAERSNYIRSGSVFVWEESEEAIGLRRWTDGLNWSASRMREPFLYYESKRRARSGTTSSNASAPGERFSIDTTSSSSSTDGASPRTSSEHDIPGLIKQTYSAIVMGDGSKRKWHMTAYFTSTDIQSLPTVGQDPTLRSLKVPKGMYRSGKSRQSARSIQAEWGSSSSTDLASFQDSQQMHALGITVGNGYESTSPTGSPTFEYPYSSGRSSPPSPYPRPGSSQRPRTAPYPSSYEVQPSPTGYFRPPPSQSPQHMLQPPASSYPHRPPSQQPPNILPPLTSTYADQRYVVATQRSTGRTSEDERMLHMFRSVP